MLSTSIDLITITTLFFVDKIFRFPLGRHHFLCYTWLRLLICKAYRPQIYLLFLLSAGQSFLTVRKIYFFASFNASHNLYICCSSLSERVSALSGNSVVQGRFRPSGRQTCVWCMAAFGHILLWMMKKCNVFRGKFIISWPLASQQPVCWLWQRKTVVGSGENRAFRGKAKMRGFPSALEKACVHTAS